MLIDGSADDEFQDEEDDDYKESGDEYEDEDEDDSPTYTDELEGID
jgi:hypothetical protein